MSKDSASDTVMATGCMVALVIWVIFGLLTGQCGGERDYLGEYLDDCRGDK